MKKQSWLKIINVILVILAIWQLVTALFKSQIGYEAFEYLHPVGGYLFTLFILFHVLLNWNWMKSAYFKK